VRASCPARNVPGGGCVHTAGVMVPCRALGPVGSLCVLLVLAVSCAAPARTPVTTPAPTPPSGVATPAPPAGGTPVLWRITHPGKPGDIEGFADHTSITAGQRVHLFVSTTAQPGSKQAAAVVAQPTNTVTAPWQPSLAVSTAGWAPGDYLIRLDGDNDAQQFVPLTVRTPSNTGRIVVINAVTTWQAYNRWGGFSLYDSPSGRKANRSRAVSFDRPYQADTMAGAGDFLYFELPFLRFAEASGHPIGYATDVDLHADPHLLDGARAVITLGHDEYWSAAMRNQVVHARDTGTNLAFLGGNEIYRHIRLDPTPLGPDRLEIDYKSFTEDPASTTNPLAATQEWRSPPTPRPRYSEAVLIDDPWGYGNSLEWATSCPPPRHNFTAIPRIRSERPAFELHYPHMVDRIREEAYTGGGHASAAPSERLTNLTEPDETSGHDPKSR